MRKVHPIMLISFTNCLAKTDVSYNRPLSRNAQIPFADNRYGGALDGAEVTRLRGCKYNPTIGGAKAARRVLTIAMSLTMSMSSYAASSRGSEPIARDASALTLLADSVRAMKASAQSLSLQSCTVSGDISQLAADGISMEQGSFTEKDLRVETRWEFATHKMMQEHTVEISSGGGHSIAVKDGTLLNIKEVPQTTHAPYFMPATLLGIAISDANFSITDRGTQTRRGRSTRQVEITPSRKGSPDLLLRQEWYFAPDSLLPLEVEYGVATETRAAQLAPRRVIFNGITTLDDIATATLLEFYRGSKLVETRHINSLDCNSPVRLADIENAGGTR
jgi:hypothetical protein